jgi:hypothetical protein
MPDQGIVEGAARRVGEGASVLILDAEHTRIIRSAADGANLSVGDWLARVATSQRDGVQVTDMARDLGNIASAVRQFHELLEGIDPSERLDLLHTMLGALMDRIEMIGSAVHA